MINIKNILKLLIIANLINFSFASTGDEIYNNYCSTCHSAAMSSIFSSPAVHDNNAWDERKNITYKKLIEQNNTIESQDTETKKEAIIEELTKSAIKGTEKGMPPMGTCSSCSQEEIKNAIKFMSNF